MVRTPAKVGEADGTRNGLPRPLGRVTKLAYESDFGVLKVVPNRFQRTRDVFCFQMDLWAVAYVNGRRMVSTPLAQTGDSVRRLILSEYTLESRNEKASGLVTDLTTS